MNEDVMIRLNKAYNHLRISGLFSKQEEAANILGMSRTNLSSALNGKESRLTLAFVQNFCDKFDTISKPWLLTGEGDMLVSSSHVENPTSHEKKSPSHADESTKEGERGMKYYYEMDATAGVVDVFDSEMGQPYQMINFPGYEGCVAFNVMGESMMPTAKPGDIVVVIPQPVEVVVNGEVYLVVTRDNQRMIKRVVMEGEGITCYSDNPDQRMYAPQHIDGNLVVSLYRVRGFIAHSIIG